MLPTFAGMTNQRVAALTRFLLSQIFLLFLSLSSWLLQGVNPSVLLTSSLSAMLHQKFNQPHLQDYLNNKNKRKSSGEGGYYWAQKLHDAILDHDNINNLVSSVIHGQGDIHQQLRVYGTVLNLLHPSGKLAQDAYTKLLAVVFGTLTETMNPQSLKDKIAPWVKDFIKEWVSKFDKGEPPTIDKKQHEAWEIAEAFKEAAHLAGDLTELANEITNLIVTERVSNISERSSETQYYNVRNILPTPY